MTALLGAGRLPVELSSFVGRECEIATARGLVLDSRCLTLTGVGGSGKTRLALELASQLDAAFRGGAVFVDLAPISHGDAVGRAIAEALGVIQSAKQGVVEALVNALREAHVLLVLDNCEQVVDACAIVVEQLLKGSSDLRVLATSRQPLDIPGEVSYAVPPLAVPEDNARVSMPELMSFESVRLFADRARSLDPEFALDESNLASVVTICRCLDGLPLAVELAAARTRSLSPHEIAQRLRDSFGVLARGRRTTTPRHQTLRATIDWSHDLLDEFERVLFRRLAVFSGGWILDDAQRVCAVEPLPFDILDVHDGLLQKSLIVADASPMAPTRYRFLETIRQYAVERLRACGELVEMQPRHFACLLARAEHYDSERTLKGSDAGLPAIARERENLRAALTWAIDADPAGALRLTTALDDFWHMVSPAEGWRWLQHALRRGASGGVGRARALLVAGKLAGYVHAYAEGAGLLRETKALAEESHDKLLAAAAELWLGRLAIFAEDPASAERHLENALKRLEALSNPLGQVRALALLGLLQAVILEHREAGEPKLRAASELARGIGDSWGDGYTHMMLSICAADACDASAVRAHAASALDTPSIAPLHGVPMQQLARVLVDEDPARTLLLLGAASALLQRDGTEEPDFLARRAEAACQRAVQLVGETTARRLFDEGRQLGPSDVRDLVSEQRIEQHVRPGGLTQRELQVAVLVGRLQTNRDIARTLFISVRTAESHIEHILAKLNLKNRQELAAWARANGLVSEESSGIR